MSTCSCSGYMAIFNKRQGDPDCETHGKAIKAKIKKDNNDAEGIGYLLGMIVGIGLLIFCLKVFNQNNLKTKQMQTDCLIQTQMKECIQIGSNYGQAVSEVQGN